MESAFFQRGQVWRRRVRASAFGEDKNVLVVLLDKLDSLGEHLDGLGRVSTIEKDAAGQNH